VRGALSASRPSLAEAGVLATPAAGIERRSGEHPVVREERNFVVLGELPVGLDAGRAPDLLLGDWHLHVFAPRGRPGQRDEQPLGAQQPGMQARPLGLIGLV